MSDHVPHFQMGDVYFINWWSILGPVLTQKRNVCWAISLTRQLEALYNIDGVPGEDQQLSIQCVINGILYEPASYGSICHGSICKEKDGGLISESPISNGKVHMKIEEGLVEEHIKSIILDQREVAALVVLWRTRKKSQTIR